ncbi:signal peptidase I [Chloroflexota bacterium]
MRRTLREILQTALLALLLFSGLQASVQNFRVEGSSMETTLEDGQHLLVNRLVYYRLDKARLAEYLPFMQADPGEVIYLFHPPQRGEVIVFRYPKDPSRDFVKRIVATPGDTVEIRGGKGYVNGALLEEPYIVEPQHITMERKVMGPGQYFVMGDNRLHSNDSRNWGPVPLENIVGRVWMAYWPLSDMTLF